MFFAAFSFMFKKAYNRAEFLSILTPLMRKLEQFVLRSGLFISEIDKSLDRNPRLLGKDSIDTLLRAKKLRGSLIERLKAIRALVRQDNYESDRMVMALLETPLFDTSLSVEEGNPVTPEHWISELRNLLEQVRGQLQQDSRAVA